MFIDTRTGQREAGGQTDGFSSLAVRHVDAAAQSIMRQDLTFPPTRRAAQPETQIKHPPGMFFKGYKGKGPQEPATNVSYFS